MHFCSDFHPKVQQNSNINIKSLIIIIELTIPKRQIEVRFLMKSGLILRDSCDIAKRQFYDIPAPFIEWFFASIFFSIDFTMDYIDFVLPECLHTKI